MKKEVYVDARLLGRKNPKPVAIPNNNFIPRLTFLETMIEVKKSKTWTTYFAFGKVVKICKSNDFDLVYVDFGLGKDNCGMVYFRLLNSRKQIYTLKVGQYAQFGMVQPTEEAKKRKRFYIAIWCMGIYVPKSVDIRNTELTEEEINELSEEEYGEGLTFLDQFQKND